MRKRPSTATSSPTSVPSIQEPPSNHRREPSSTSKEPRNVTLTKLPSESYGLSLGTILFVKDLDYRGPAGRDGRLEPGDVILKVSSLYCWSTVSNFQSIFLIFLGTVTNFFHLYLTKKIGKCPRSGNHFIPPPNPSLKMMLCA